MLVLLLLMTTAATLLVQSSNGQGCKRRVCYFYNDAQHRRIPEARFFPENIDPALCSHIIYNRAFFNGNDVAVGEKSDESTISTVGGYQQVTGRMKDFGLPVLLTIDGGRCVHGSFLRVSINDSSRNEFIVNVIKFLRKHDFDGLNLRCVFVAKSAINPSVKAGMSKLVAELRQAFDQDATGSDRLLLSLDVVGRLAIDDDCYDVATLSQNVDWINLLAFTLHGFWAGTTGHHSPLYPQFEAKGNSTPYSVHAAVHHWVSSGAPKEKLVLGLTAWASSYTLTSSDTGIGAPASYEKPTDYNLEDALLAYYEICRLPSKEGVVVTHLQDDQWHYLVSGNLWVSYEDMASIRRKVRLIKNRRLGGYAFMSLDLDDFSGHFCGMGPYPLLVAANMECSN